jgi:GGDEF domain-containing protein
VERRKGTKILPPRGSSDGDVPSVSASPQPPVRRLWPAVAALILSGVGGALQALQGLLLPAWRAELVFVGAAVTVAAVALGDVAGLVAAAAVFAVIVALSQSAAIAVAVVVAQAFAASRLYRRLRSVVLSALAFWTVVGGGAAVLGWTGLIGVAGAREVIPIALGGLLAAVAADLLLLRPQLWRLLGSTPQPPADVTRYVAPRALLIVGIPLTALALDRGASADALAKGIALTMVAAVTLDRIIAIAGAAVTRALDHIDRAASEVEAGGLSPQAADAAPPVAEVLRLDSSVRGLHEGLAYHDALTGLPNRKLLLDRTALAIAQASGSEGPALLVVDLDRFRSIDGFLGHERGNTLLKKVGERLGSCVRAGDTVARLGGDEFALLMPGLGEIGRAHV